MHVSLTILASFIEDTRHKCLEDITDLCCPEWENVTFWSLMMVIFYGFFEGDMPFLVIIVFNGTLTYNTKEPVPLRHAVS